MNLALIFAMISFLASATYLVLLITFHFLPTGYDPVSQPVSDYGVGKYAYLFRIYMWVSALAAIAFAGALADSGLLPISSWIFVLLLLLAITRVGISLFPTDLEGKPRTVHGMLHYIFAILTFTFVYLAISALTPVLVVVPPWQSIAGLLMILKPLVFYSLLLLVVVILVPPLKRIFGLSERLFLVSENIWFVIVTALLVTRLF
jgi:hypothetical protein